VSSTALSKSQFIRGLQCHKSLWLYKNRPDLKEDPSSSQQSLFNQGTYVGEMARKMFPGGTTIKFEEGTFEEKIKRTQELISSGVETIYEATFQYDDVLIMADVLNKGKDGWELYEVKASTKIKHVHENDIAVQYYVLNGSGIELKKAFLVHINNQYTRQGSLDINQLFTTADLTRIAKAKQGFVLDQLRIIRQAIKTSEPRVDIGPHCSDPYDCDFQKHCWKHVPQPSVFGISRLSSEKKWTLYSEGILRFDDIPENYPLNQTQKIQVEAELTGKDFVDKNVIRNFLTSLYHPLCFLDFETFNPVVPPFDEVRPYQKIPFQYSIHYQRKKGGEIYHEEFLAKEGTDPREKLALGLVEHIPENSCVLAYNCGFEKGVIRKLAKQFPKLKKQLMAIHDSILDLMDPFQKKAVYKKEMNGSYSLKSVLPAFAPEMSYEEMGISDGGQASSSYTTLHLIEDKKKRAETRKDLLEYCKLDTLAMVKILKKLEEL
jgi:hypothetical protein